MMPPGTSTVEADVQHVREPGQRHPASAVNHAKGIEHSRAGDSTEHGRIFSHVNAVVVINEITAQRWQINGNRHYSQENAQRYRRFEPAHVDGRIEKETADSSPPFP